jgi:hypothetical protein
VQLLWKVIWISLKQLKIELSHDPVLPLLGIYAKECTPGYDRATFTLMLSAALFTIAKLWKQLSCLTINEWIKKMWDPIQDGDWDIAADCMSSMKQGPC